LIITLIGGLLLLWTPFVAAQNSTPEMSTLETLYIQGSVRRIFPEKKMILVKVSKGEKMLILVGQQTGFVGISSLEELEKGQHVKVWCTVVGEENRAVKVEKLPEVGC
jgi:hypothetical protein